MTNTTASSALPPMENLPPLAQDSLQPGADHMMQVIGFHATYDVPMHNLGNKDPEFTHMDDARVSLRLGLITEEIAELFDKGFGIKMSTVYTVYEAGSPRILNEDSMKTGNALAAARRLHYPRNGVEVADALGDLIYVIYGFALELGYDLRDVVREIHASNLTKLGEDGHPILREDGKVLKGPNYVQPNIPAALGWEN